MSKLTNTQSISGDIEGVRRDIEGKQFKVSFKSKCITTKSAIEFTSSATDGRINAMVVWLLASDQDALDLYPEYLRLRQAREAKSGSAPGAG